MNFGAGEDCIMFINASQSYLDTIAADPECRLIATPANIDNALTAGQVSAIQTFLEGLGVPADWLTAGETRRQALRGIAGMFMFSQRMEGRFGISWKRKLVGHGVTLATQWSALPTAFQIELLDVAASYGWFNVTPTDTMTLRQILRAMGNRLQSVPIQISGFTL